MFIQQNSIFSKHIYTLYTDKSEKEVNSTMSKQDIVRKLSSRKFWATVVGVISGLAIVFGLDSDTITDVSGAVVSMMSIIMYVYTEGKIDAASVASITAHQEIMVSPDSKTSSAIAKQSIQNVTKTSDTQS